MQRLLLIFNGRFPSEKAAALFAAKSAEAFAGEGMEVTLLVPRRFGRSAKDTFVFYGIKKNFTLRFLPTLDLFPIPFITSVAFYVSYSVFSLSSFLYLLATSNTGDIVYSNESLPLFLISFFRKNIFYELHDMPRRKLFFYRRFFRRVEGIIVTNTWKMERLMNEWGVDEKRLLCEMNAVDLEEFAISATREEARRQLALPERDRIVLYTGHLYSWKGVEILAEAARFLGPNIQVYFVGGTTKDVGDFKDRFGSVKNIHIMGHRNHIEVPLWQRAADVVVVPNTAREAISKYDTSPMKIFEYMASKKPIVATDIPSIREILNDTNAVIVPPDDPEKIANGIKAILQDANRARELAERAYNDVQIHTWQKRAYRIIAFLKDQ